VPGMWGYIERQPQWIIFFTGLVSATVIGYIDYLTGNYSLLIFYLVPIALVSWITGFRGGIVIAMVSGLARLYADYAAFTNKRLLYWNSLEDAVFLMFAAFLIVLLRKALGAHHND
jgi:hypothetical protein